MSPAELIEAALSGYRDFDAADRAEALARLLPFVEERLHSAFEREFPKGAIRAVLAGRGVRLRLPDARLRIEALAALGGSEDLAALSVAATRVRRILPPAVREGAPLDPGRFVAPAEKALHTELLGAEERVRVRFRRGEYASGLSELAALRPAVDRFFDEVLVMAEDPELRANRLALLARLDGLFAKWAISGNSMRPPVRSGQGTVGQGTVGLMGRIRRLPVAVANQIAAGEVVERPAAAVRELVENAIDAGASAVSVIVRGAGKTGIRVTDDGVGMSPEDARLALERHATSKIASLDDLTAIGSLGFRGEALPSIASVSRFRLRTRAREADAGWEISTEGGEALSERPAGMAPGTVVEVRDLFYNTPARRKFLRADATESSHIVAAVSHLAVAWPQVRFELESAGRESSGRESAQRRVLSLEPAEDTASRLGQLEPRWIRDAIPVEARAGELALRAFLSPPMAPRGAASRLLLFVNGRAIRDRRLLHAITDAYRRVSSLQGAPKAYLFLEIPPELVDFNVHPAKAEARFAEADAAYRAVFRGVLAALEGSPKRVDLGPAEGRPGRLRGAGPGPGVGAASAAAPGPAAARGGGRAREAVTAPAGDGREIGELLYGLDADGPADASAGIPGYLDFGDRPPSRSASSARPTSSPRTATSSCWWTSTRRRSGCCSTASWNAPPPPGRSPCCRRFRSTCRRSSGPRSSRRRSGWPPPDSRSNPSAAIPSSCAGFPRSSAWGGDSMCCCVRSPPRRASARGAPATTPVPGSWPGWPATPPSPPMCASARSA